MKSWIGSKPMVRQSANADAAMLLPEFFFIDCSLPLVTWHIVQKLDTMHKKHLLPGFDDRIQEERDIERLTDEITQVWNRNWVLPITFPKTKRVVYLLTGQYGDACIFLAIPCLSKEDQADQFREQAVRFKSGTDNVEERPDESCAKSAGCFHPFSTKTKYLYAT